MQNHYNREKTLFISDLDGTLLSKTAEISPFTRDTLTRLLASEYNFTIATARMAHSVEKLFEGVDLKLPLVLMNGSMIFDARARRYLNVESLSPAAVDAIVAAAKANGADILLYRIDGDDMDVARYYATADNARLNGIFMDDSLKKRRRIDRVVYGLDGIDTSVGTSVYVTFADTREKLLPVYETVVKIPGVAVVMSKDDYTESGWFVECFSANASKANATRRLREKLGFEYVVAFGDNMNDIDFIRDADEGYAPENATPETRAVARAILAANSDDGVAKWLAENLL
ncbi:MAG: HAD family hydrolase [Oscillospiraceae bacterium]|jgi:Cof subfamily protein (haloacid dehalogenase superfamily)|nr:HAD family hydrolase [Oscillospiraceae bacterium]